MKFSPVVFLLAVIALLSGCGQAQSQPDTSLADRVASGQKLYLNNCAACHMADGSGVPDMQPALNGNAVVAGDPNLLIRVVLQGPAQVLPADRPKFSNQMPPFARLSDSDIADILTYVRQQFGAQASAVEPSQVGGLRTH